ncbi:MAG: ABC transporter permease [Candidatus Melainabacteria bacterium]|nr:ABC transporter permease [Candidatus Melainabacteria bacterium]
MLNTVLRRLLAGFLTLWVILTITFVLIRVLPGGPFQNPKVPESVQQALAAKYHLDAPVWVQYGAYMQGLLQGDLGPSLTAENRRVNDLVAESTGYSVQIGIPAMLLGSLLGVALGALAGLTRLSWLDAVLSVVGTASLAMPSFVFAGGLVLVFALGLQWLPAATVQTPGHYILPVVALSLSPFAFCFALIRNTVRENRLQPFVRVKQAAGLPPLHIALRHVLRNSLLPLLSILGPLTAAIVTGSFAVEYIFAVPGLGKHFINAVGNRDYTVVMGITVLYSVVLIVLNLLTDLLMGWLDPRLREGR